jgi:hypothetical protein
VEPIKVSKSNPEIKRIVAACYPAYKGRKIRVAAATQYHMSNYWDGGSRDYVVAYSLATGEVSAPSRAASNPMNGAAHSTVEIPAGVALVEHTIFCGKGIGIRIYVNPANMPLLLSA